MNIRSITPPFLSLFVFMISVGFFLTYTSLRMEMEGYDTYTIGIISSGYYMGFLVGALWVKEFINRVQHRRAFIVLASILIMATMVQGLLINRWAWFLTRFVSGICISGFFVVMQSWFLVTSPYYNRGRIFSIYMVGVYAATALSQFLINIVEIATLMPFLLSGLISSLSLVPITVSNSVIPNLQRPIPSMIWKIWKKSPFGVSSCLAGGAFLGSIYTFLPLFAVENELPVSNLMFVAIIGSVFFQWPLGWFTDHFDTRKIIISVSGLIFCTAAIVFVYPGNHNLVYIGTFLMSGLCFTIYPMGITQTCERLKEMHMTTATGALLFAFGIGAIVSPMIAPFFISNLSYAGLFLYIAVIALLLMIFGIITILYFSSQTSEDPQIYESPSSITDRVKDRLDK